VKFRHSLHSNYCDQRVGSKGEEDTVRFAVIGVDHPHAVELTTALDAAGAACIGWGITDDDPNQVFRNVFPDLPCLAPTELLADRPDLVVTAGVPNTRGMWSTQAMDAGADVLVACPGALGQGQLAEIDALVSTTGRRWWVAFTDHFASRAVIRAHQLVSQGRIGVPRHLIGIGPHRRSSNRPDWFTDPFRSGSMIADLAAQHIHHAARFLDGTDLDVLAARTTGWADGGHPDAIAEVLLEGGTGSAYIRVDWLTPRGSPTWGDVRLMVTGDAGTIEIRQNIDLDGQPGDEHLLVVDQNGVHRIDCRDVAVSWAADLILDVRDRTERVVRTRDSINVMRIALHAADIAKD